MTDMLHPLPYASWETRGWWEGCGRGELVLQRCRTCGTVQHKPRALCAKCLTDTVDPFVASGRGTVHTFTVTRQNAVPPFRDHLPYVLAYVELDEGPRIVTNVKHCRVEDVHGGMRVSIFFEEVTDSITLPQAEPA